MTDSLKTRIAEAMYKALHNRVPAANCDDAAQAVMDIVEPMIPKWMPIETAPETGENYLGAIEQPDGSFGEPFICFYEIDEGHICLHQTEAKLHRPTHFMPLSTLTSKGIEICLKI